MSRDGYGLSDDELDSMFDDAPDPHQQGGLALAPQQQQMMTHHQQQQMQQQPQMPYQVFPLGQAPQDGLLTRRVLGVPVWGWASLVAVAGGGTAAWWYFTQRDVKKNDGEPSLPELPSSLDGGEWGPSRTAISDALRHYYIRKGQNGVLILKAEDAKKRRLPHVSPVVTIKTEGKGVIDKELQRLCKREGLSPLVHADGTIGLYPASGKKGREWEKYIDELRDAGQEA
jgi:hypothetical protein